MKRLVLLGEGHGEVPALPVLVRKLLKGKGASDEFYADKEVIRTNPFGLVKWDQTLKRPDYTKWIQRIELAARKPALAGVLAVYDGDAPKFPAGSSTAFCASRAAKEMAEAAKQAGAGAKFSLCVVFACKEYETWLVAAAECFAGKRYADQRPILSANVKLPAGDFEARGKRWLEENCANYRPTRDQSPLTELLDLEVLRAKRVRSFQRFDHAIEQILAAAESGRHVATPC